MQRCIEVAIKKTKKWPLLPMRAPQQRGSACAPLLYPLFYFWLSIQRSATSYQRWHIALTSMRCCIEVKCLLGILSFTITNWLIVLGFNDTSTHEGHFVSSPREREKRDRRESRGDKREGQGRKRNRNESEETEEIKTFPLYPYPLQG